ncbi:MAG: energy-coupling factor transporter ATPase [Clostridia bacterium]|nr:energy-coupling factor transporter ATPase [Clostridia bacterium]
MQFIDVKNVVFGYGIEDENESPKIVLKDLSLSVKKGEFVALLGHNGSGKSTLAKMFNGILQPEEGKVAVCGFETSNDDDLLEIRKRVGLVLQNPDNQLVASIVEEDVAFGPENLGIEPKEIRRRVDEALKAVDMYEYRGHAPHKLSGGQKQRVAIAGIIAMQPECIVLDEPTAMLDPQGRREVMDTIVKLNKEKNITIILITHYMDEAALADRLVVLDGGKILTQGTPREVFSQAELLRSHSLDVPQSTELAHKLKSAGVKIDGTPLNVLECVEKIDKVLRIERI